MCSVCRDEQQLMFLTDEAQRALDEMFERLLRVGREEGTHDRD